MRHFNRKTVSNNNSKPPVNIINIRNRAQPLLENTQVYLIKFFALHRFVFTLLIG